MFRLLRILSVPNCVLFILLFSSCLTNPSARIRNPYERIKLSGEPIELGSASITSKDFWARKAVNVPCVVLLYTDEDLSVLDFRYQGNKYDLVFNRASRNYIFEAFLNYDKGYNEKDLKISRKTRKAYGAIYSMVRWGSFMKSSIAYPLMSVGYGFTERSPYFTLHLPETQNREASSFSPGDMTNFHPMEVMFTRRQMREILELWEANDLLGARQFTPLEALPIDEY